jgi:hypothetical protein
MVPTIIVSSGRCGSTILSQILNEHPDIAVIQDFWSYRSNRLCLMRPNSITGPALWRLLSKPTSRALYQFLEADMIPTALAVHGRDENVLLRTTLPALFDDPTLVLHDLQDFVSRLGHKDKSDHFNLIFAFLARLCSKPVWVERTGGSIRYLEVLLALFPNARFLHLYRDGRNCALSMSRHPTFVYGYTKCSTPQKLPDVCFALMSGGLSKFDLVAIQVGCASEWATNVITTRGLLNGLPANQTLAVSFEALLSQPRAELRRILGFILDGDHCSDAWLDAQVPRLRIPACDYRRLDTDLASMLTQASEKGLAEFGYL